MWSWPISRYYSRLPPEWRRHKTTINWIQFKIWTEFKASPAQSIPCKLAAFYVLCNRLPCCLYTSPFSTVYLQYTPTFFYTLHNHLKISAVYHTKNIWGTPWWGAVLQIGRLLVRSQLVSLQFFIDIKSFRSHYSPGVDSAFNRNEYQEYFLGVKAAVA